MFIAARVSLVRLFCATALLSGPALIPAHADQPGDYSPLRGTNPIASLLQEWRDDVRERTIPVKIYYPVGPAEKCPAIMFSHGLGGTREGYAYLGAVWASNGYIVVHLQHPGSDANAFMDPKGKRRSPRDVIKDPANLLNRPLDVTFALNRLEILNREDPVLKGRFDMSRIGIGGHSFGAYTALAMAGQRFITPNGRQLPFGDPRIKAAFVVSAPVRSDHTNSYAYQYGAIGLPCLHLTGTRDDSLVSDTTAGLRRVPFDYTSAPRQYLAVLKDADHMIFSGRRRDRAAAKPADARHMALSVLVSTAFWDAYLKDDIAARRWLDSGGFATLLGADGTFEKK